MFLFLYTKLFQKRGHYSRGDIIQGRTLIKEIRYALLSYDLSWSLKMEWINKNPLFYGFFATLAVGGCGGHGCYFQPNPRVRSQMFPSRECTDFVFIT